MIKKLPSLIATIISLLLILLGTVGLIALQKPLREESQDIRKDASVTGGQVIVSGSPSSGSTLEIGTATIDLKTNTQGVQTDGVQLVFNIITNTLGGTPSISVLSGSGLQSAYQQVEQTGDGYLISVIALPAQINQTFSSTSATTIAQISLPIAQAGNVEISFDREKSKSIIHDTNPPQDALNHVDALNFTVVSSDDNNDDDDNDSDDDNNDGDNDDTSDDGDNDANTGGVTVKGCNLSCDSNAECETNHRCYNNQCRLVTNVSSTTCQSQPDQGLNFGCNQYCADSRECDSEFSCLENKCRRSDNPDDQYCRVPSSTVQADITASCSTTCGINADCAANLRCYYGLCRLATNPSSTSCSATTTKTVSTLYTKEVTNNKGGDLDDEEINQETDQEATDSTPAAIIKPTTKPSPTPSPSLIPALPEEKTALDAVINSLNQTGLPVNLLPVIALAAGGLLLLIVLIPKIFGNKKTQVYKSQSTTTTKNDQYEQELQAKLSQLKEQTPPITPQRPPQKPGMSPVPPTQPPVINEPPPINSQPASMPQSPMIDRVKNKGIVPPRARN